MSLTGIEWMDRGFFESQLQAYYKNSNICVASIDVNPGVGKCENFNSLIYRVKVQFTVNQDECPNVALKEESILVKIQLPTLISSLSHAIVFDKEGEMYSCIFPKMKTLLNQLHESAKLLPELIGICANKAISIEDLSVKGYSISSKLIGLNLSDAKLVLHKAAIFHATCAVLQEHESNIFENFKHGCINRVENSLEHFYLTNFDAFCHLIASIPELAHLNAKLVKLRSKFIEKTCITLDANPSQFNTLAHGDMWINNLLLLRDNQTKRLNDVIFIDFQFSVWTSPAIDLQYFFNTSLEEDVRSNHTDELIAFYHNQLAAHLKELHFKKQIPTLPEFQQQFLAKSFFGFFSSCVLQPLIYNENVENDHETIVIGNEKTAEIKRRIFSTSRVKEYVQRLIPMYDRLGVFD